VQELDGRFRSLVATSTSEAGSFAAQFFAALKTQLAAWFADATNGITEFFAKVGNFHLINTDELCVGSTCLTEAQLQSLLANAGGANVPPPSGDNPVPIPDTEAPVITINGANPAHLLVGDSYADLGATVSDNVDQNLGLKTFLNGALVSDIVLDTSAEATSTIDYVATDNAGNTATSTRNVIVEAAPAM
jgi:hypothetical protein